eukprot:1255699-Amphidinium_carterae.1
MGSVDVDQVIVLCMQPASSGEKVVTILGHSEEQQGYFSAIEMDASTAATALVPVARRPPGLERGTRSAATPGTPIGGLLGGLSRQQAAAEIAGPPVSTQAQREATAPQAPLTPGVGACPKRRAAAKPKAITQGLPKAAPQRRRGLTVLAAHPEEPGSEVIQLLRGMQDRMQSLEQ